ncbi:unnamed protein product [Mesocestoides corti]|uniref:ADF-H domain-containing protein n=1 Tax=Mesocestoides corti TaxID=53468 RepID=A0A0R3UJ16_MESCO|nr:unnamed protein product [Mesocestoides corti]
MLHRCLRRRAGGGAGGGGKGRRSGEPRHGRNGHKLTHASKKPHGCQFCDKSYSDARSLRRHYENAHPDEYESWCFLSRAAEEGDATIVEAVAKMTQLSTSSCSTTNGASGAATLAQQLVAAKEAGNCVVTFILIIVTSLVVANQGPASRAALAFLAPVAHSTSDEPLVNAVRAYLLNSNNCVDVSNFFILASSDRSSPWLPNNGGGGCGSGRTSPVISDHLKAVLMALPLEEPRVVACTVCPRRFKNQSALNGHMRLHGGYGLNNVGSTSSSSSVSSGKRSQPSQQPPSPPLGPLPSSSSRAAATKPKKHLSSTHDRPMGDIILRDLSEGNQLPRPEDPSVFDWSATPTTATTTMTTPASEADTSQSQRRTPSPQPHCSSTKANLHSLRNLGLTSPGVEAPSPMNTSLVNSQWSARHAPGLLQQQQQSSFNPALTKERFPGVPMFPSTQSPFSLPEVTSITESSSGSYPPTAPSRLSSSLPRLHSDLQCVGDCSATCRQEENASHFAPNPPPPLPAYPALRKRAPFGQQQQQQQFRAAPGLAWFQPQHPQIGDRVESDLLFSSVASNLRLMETQPIGTTAFRDQGLSSVFPNPHPGRYISRLTPAPSSPSSSSSSSRLFHSAYPSQQRLPGSKFDPLAAFCAAAAVAVSGDPVFSQAGFFPGYSTAETSGPQPHYSPITPASSGFSSSTSAPAFTFPPSEALLSTTSPPLPPPPPVSQKNKEFYTQSMQFVCPPRSSPFGEPASQPSKWVPPPPPSVEPFMSSSPSITPAAQFSPHRQRSHQHSQVYQVHGRTPLYPSADQQDVKQETPTAFPSPVAPHFAQQTPVYDQQRHPVGSGPRSVCCGNISADGFMLFSGCVNSGLFAHACVISCRSVMRHPMTPQHHAYAGHPRAYSYTSTTTHAAYSVPIMSSQERVFFPDDLDPLLALESDEDYGRPTTPKVDTVPPLHQQQQQRHQQQPYEQIQLSSVPSHKYQSTAQLAQPVSVLLSDEPSVFRNPQAPPPSVKKQKRKPAPIIIPSSAHRLNASRLRSPRLWTVSSVGGPTANASVKNDLLSGLLEPPPYTPPPMLSPNRRGSGLFSSIARNRRTLAICSAAAAVGTFRPRNTPVPIRRASPAPPKSAPAFVKNASYFSQDINPKVCLLDLIGPLFWGSRSRVLNLIPFSMSQRNSWMFVFVYPSVLRRWVCYPALCSLRNIQTLINDQAGGGIDGNSDRLNGLGAATRAIMRTVEDIGGKDQAKPKSLFFGEDEDDLDGLVVVSRRRDTPDTEEAKSNSPGGASTGTSRSFSSCCCSPVRHTVDVDVEEEDEDDIVEDIGVPSNFEPKINIGPAYQVEVPEFVEGSCEPPYQNDSRAYEVLLWHPKNIDESDPKTEESLANLMNLARSSVVRNCGLNMEYTFHLLCKFQGDFETTLRALLHESFTIFDRVYSETEYWTTEEIEKFQSSLRRHDKDFHHVSAELRAYGMNKSVKACVEFYYVWKRMNTPHEVNRYRGRIQRRVVPTRSERLLLEEPQPSSDLCDLADLDNHGSFDLGMQALEVDASSDGTTYNLRRKHTNGGGSDILSEIPPNVVSFPFQEGNFPCRHCGRSFAKVKSRNAHMKCHGASAARATTAKKRFYCKSGNGRRVGFCATRCVKLPRRFVASGVKCSENCIAKYNELKLKKTCRFILFKIDGEKEITVDQVGCRDCTFENFKEELNKLRGDARYAVLDFEPEANKSDLVFVTWIPSDATVRTRMLYASSVDALKAHLTGFKGVVQITDPDDLSVEHFLSCLPASRA